jgi:hypothetical protein
LAKLGGSEIVFESAERTHPPVNRAVQKPDVDPRRIFSSIFNREFDLRIARSRKEATVKSQVCPLDASAWVSGSS